MKKNKLLIIPAPVWESKTRKALDLDDTWNIISVGSIINGRYDKIVIMHGAIINYLRDEDGALSEAEQGHYLNWIHEVVACRKTKACDSIIYLP